MRSLKINKELYDKSDPFWKAVDERAQRNRSMWQTVLYAVSIHGYSPQRIHQYKLALSKHFRCSLWQTQDGCVIPLIMMNNEHLRNSFDYHHRILIRLRDESTVETMAQNWELAQKSAELMLMLSAEMNRRGIDYGQTKLDEIRDDFTNAEFLKVVQDKVRNQDNW